MKKGFISEKIMWHISGLGTALFMLVLAITVFLAGYELLALQLLAALAVSFAVAFPAKILFFKDRPNKKKHKNWIEKFDAASFPSLHSNRAALLFIILSVFFGRLPLAIFLAVVSVLVAYSRISLKRHFISDIAVGYCLGLLEGALIALFIQ